MESTGKTALHHGFTNTATLHGIFPKTDISNMNFPGIWSDPTTPHPLPRYVYGKSSDVIAVHNLTPSTSWIQQPEKSVFPAILQQRKLLYLFRWRPISVHLRRWRTDKIVGSGKRKNPVRLHHRLQFDCQNKNRWKMQVDGSVGKPHLQSAVYQNLRP